MEASKALDKQKEQQCTVQTDYEIDSELPLSQLPESPTSTSNDGVAGHGGQDRLR